MTSAGCGASFVAQRGGARQAPAGPTAREGPSGFQCMTDRIAGSGLPGLTALLGLCLCSWWESRALGLVVAGARAPCCEACAVGGIGEGRGGGGCLDRPAHCASLPCRRHRPPAAVAASRVESMGFRFGFDLRSQEDCHSLLCMFQVRINTGKNTTLKFSEKKEEAKRKRKSSCGAGHPAPELPTIRTPADIYRWAAPRTCSRAVRPGRPRPLPSRPGQHFKTSPMDLANHVACNFQHGGVSGGWVGPQRGRRDMSLRPSWAWSLALPDRLTTPVPGNGRNSASLLSRSQLRVEFWQTKLLSPGTC